MGNPHPQVIAVSRLLENLAGPVTDAFDHIRRELAVVGYPTSAPLASPSTAPNPKAEYDKWGKMLPPVTLQPTERAAFRAEQFARQRRQLIEDVESIARIIYDMQNTVEFVTHTRLSIAADRCTADPGLDGYDIALSDGGWHDPLCRNPPRSNKGGLCNACRQKADRWRFANDKKPLADERTIDHESHVTINDDGVALIRPIRGAA